MNIKQELGEKIKRLRKRKGFTQEQLAEIVEISSRNISNIELGISFPKPETLEKILKALNTTTQELYATDHIKSEEELIAQINNYIETVKNDKSTLEKIYKIIRDLIVSD